MKRILLAEFIWENERFPLHFYRPDVKKTSNEGSLKITNINDGNIAGILRYLQKNIVGMSIYATYSRGNDYFIITISGEFSELREILDKMIISNLVELKDKQLTLDGAIAQMIIENI